MVWPQHLEVTIFSHFRPLLFGKYDLFEQGGLSGIDSCHFNMQLEKGELPFIDGGANGGLHCVLVNCNYTKGTVLGVCFVVSMVRWIYAHLY